MVRIYTDIRQGKFNTGDIVKPKEADGPVCKISGVSIRDGQIIYTLQFGQFDESLIEFANDEARKEAAKKTGGTVLEIE